MRTLSIVKKRVLVLFFASMFLIIPSRKAMPFKVAYAQSEGEYLRVVDQNTPFYQNANADNLLFYLPYSYYVKVLSRGETLSHVECYDGRLTPTLDGFVPTSLLEEVDYLVESPFLQLETTTRISTPLYADSNLSQSTRIIFANRTLGVFGTNKSPSGENLFFVYYNGQVGYVKEGDLTPFEMPLHPKPVAPETPPAPQAPSSPTLSNETQVIKIAIVVCLMLAGFFALFIAFRKKTKNPTSISYYEEGDFE